MGRKVSRRLGLAACVAAVCLLAGHGTTVVCEEAAADISGDWPGLLFPRDRSVLMSGDLDLICKTPAGPLEVEGETYDWEPFEPPVHVAHLSLYNGRNQIRLGDRQLEIFVARSKQDPRMPEGWEIFRRHPIDGHGAKRCGECHEVTQKGQRFVIGEPKSYEACFECHEPIEFEVIHSHPLEPLEPCQSCHALHGSTRKALLKAPVKKLCDACHES